MMPVKKTGASTSAEKAGKPSRSGSAGAARPRRKVAPAKEPTPAQRAAEAAAAVQKMRTALDASLMRFAERIGGELDRVKADLSGAEPPSLKAIGRVMERLDDVKLKPAKGRIKDLARLEDLAEDLADLIPPKASGAS